MKKRSLLLITVLMVVLLFALSVPVHAGPPGLAQGSWFYRPITQVVEKVVGGNLFMTINDEGYWTGTFACGTSDEPDSEDWGSVVIHGEGEGHWNYKGTVLFSDATVDDKTGDIEMRVSGKITEAGADWDGKWVITGGTGELEDLRGQGIFWGAGWSPDLLPLGYGEVEYSGNYHFELD